MFTVLWQKKAQIPASCPERCDFHIGEIIVAITDYVDLRALATHRKGVYIVFLIG